ncbi:hypothetical protein ACFL4X_00325 [Gemmatimonadota bacterium]
MNQPFLNSGQIQQLIDSWKEAGSESKEQKLIEDLFLLTGTPFPVTAPAIDLPQ